MTAPKPKLGDLDFDALKEAREFLGDLDTPGSTALGFFLHRANCEVKERRLSQAGDTYWTMRYELAAMIYMSEGFRLELEEGFVDKYGEGETFFVFTDLEAGHIICGDTFGGRVNRATLYYQAVVQPGSYSLGRGSSYPRAIDGSEIPPGGPYDVPFMVLGDRDCREGFRQTMKQLRAWDGEFLQQWRAPSHASLYHHGQCPARGPDDPKYNVVAIKRLNATKLPDEVRQAFLLDTPREH